MRYRKKRTFVVDIYRYSIKRKSEQWLILIFIKWNESKISIKGRRQCIKKMLKGGIKNPRRISTKGRDEKPGKDKH